MPYKGTLKIAREEKFEDNDEGGYPGSSTPLERYIDGYITPFEPSTAKSLGELAKIGSISFRSVKVPFYSSTIKYNNFMGSIEVDWGDVSRELYFKTIEKYYLTGGGSFYDFAEEQGIELRFDIYRSHVAFHLSELEVFSDMPKSAIEAHSPQIEPEAQSLQTKPLPSLQDNEITCLAVLLALVEFIVYKTTTITGEFDDPIDKRGKLSLALESTYSNDNKGMSESNLNKTFAAASSFFMKGKMPEKNDNKYNLFVIFNLIDFILHKAATKTKIRPPIHIKTEDGLIDQIAASFPDNPHISKTELKNTFMLSKNNNYIK